MNADQLAALVKEWRNEGRRLDAAGASYAAIYRACADDLEATLSSAAPRPIPFDVVAVSRAIAEAVEYQFARALSQWAGHSRGAHEPHIRDAKDLEADAFRIAETTLGWFRAAMRPHGGNG